MQHAQQACFTRTEMICVAAVFLNVDFSRETDLSDSSDQLP